MYIKNTQRELVHCKAIRRLYASKGNSYVHWFTSVNVCRDNVVRNRCEFDISALVECGYIAVSVTF